MKELNMKPEEIANLVVLSREKGYAIVIPQDSLYLVSKAFQKQLAHRDAQIAALDERLIRYAGIATARAEHVAEQEKQIAALTAENVALMQRIDWPMEQCPTTGAVTAVDPADFIPATDAAANALRAEGAASVGTLIRACAHEFPGHVDDIVEECAMIADNAAIKLSEGKC